MLTIEATTFSGYGGLRRTDSPRPQAAADRVLVRVTAAGVTPLDHTILSGGHLRAKAPLVLGNEGVGVVEDAGDSGLEIGSRVMFTGPYGVTEGLEDFSLFAQPPTAIAAAWREILPLIVGGSVKPVVDRVYSFDEAGEAPRHLIEDRPFGKVVLAGRSIGAGS
jgi:NADPH:quinone reductase-like Zn-dependent oxidoreductase